MRGSVKLGGVVRGSVGIQEFTRHGLVRKGGVVKGLAWFGMGSRVFAAWSCKVWSGQVKLS